MNKTSHRAAAIDIGTNTVKMAVGDLEPTGIVNLIADASEQTRLGEGTDSTGVLGAAALERTADVVARLVAQAHCLGARHVRVAATSAAREAANREELVSRLREKTGVEPVILSGEDEARVSFLAVAMDPVLGGFRGEQLVVDVGGGSTELISGIGNRLVSAVSARTGAVRLTERFLAGDPPSEPEVAAAAAGAEAELRNRFSFRTVQRLVGIGGSAVNLARIWLRIPAERTPQAHSSAIPVEGLRELVNTLSRLSVARRRDLIGLDPNRADIILAGAVILERAAHLCQAAELVVSVRGLRHGLLYEMMLAEIQ